MIKRLRARYHPRTIRYYMCGEYGGETERPHYHAVIFGKDFTDRKPLGTSESGEMFYSSEELTSLWPHGQAAVQDATPGSMGYVTRYIMTKRLGRDAKTAYGDRRPEYNNMSRKPGLGEKWYNLYEADFRTEDHAIHNGVKQAVPRYYDKLLKRKDADQLELTKQARERESRKHANDQTPERLAVREIVHEAKLRKLKRA